MIKTIYRKTSDTSRAPDRRRAPHTGRGSDSLVLIEAGASVRGFMVTGKNYSLSLYIQTTKEPKTAAGSELVAWPGFILCVPWLAVECHFCYSDKLHSKVYKYHWCGLRPSVLGQDRSQTRKISVDLGLAHSALGLCLTHCGLGLGLLGFMLCCETRSCHARCHNDLEGHSNFSHTQFFYSFSILYLEHHYCGDQRWRLHTWKLNPPSAFVYFRWSWSWS